ncbi:hypothetical protein OBBRIDRAFT_829261 [Obba rivulosa]|uniref:F-box domain-containing protein n=1 Tax=Obba rivulosa TaxID=1052685 RepID=A0A8E2DEG4_9APHY|nr:hypothetical protein OBBRIDRAFT_829261 [Obba rivulosa]
MYRKRTVRPVPGSRQTRLVWHVRGKKGSLKELPNMPLEIVFEIFSHLGPGDLINLIRTSKDLRRLLLRRSSEFIWKAAHGNVGLPECPPGLSEPALANLVYSPHCHICFKNNIRSITWEFWIRCCHDCKERLPSYSRSIPREIIPPEYSYWSILPHITLPSGVVVIYPPHLRCFIMMWNAAGGDAEKQQQVLKQQMIFTKKNMYELQMPFIWWQNNEAERRAEELVEIRYPRFDAVACKLRELGYANELSYATCSERIRKHPLVRGSSKLTERAWAKMSGTLIAVMEEERAAVLKHERTIRIQNRYGLLTAKLAEYGVHDKTSGTCHPRPADLALMPEFQRCIDSSDATTTDDAVLALFQQLPIFSERWLSHIKSDLACMISTSVEVLGSADVCALAVAWLECSFCSQRLRFEEAITSPCIRGCIDGKRCDVCFCREQKTWYERIIEGRYDTGGSPWCIHRLYSPPLIDKAIRVIRAFGQNPSLTTAQDMDFLGGRVGCVCTRCYAVMQPTVFKTWREAIIEPACERPEWVLISAGKRTDS